MTLTNVGGGTTKTRKVLNAVNQEATIWCEGQQKVGIAIPTFTGTGTVKFYGSLDGLTYNPLTVGPYPSAVPSAAGVTSATAVGNWEVAVQNYKFIRVQLTSVTGTVAVTVVLAASIDGSYQEAFLTDSAGVSLAVLNPSTTSSSGANTMTIPAQANRAIKLTFLEVSMAGPGHGANAQLRIWDGAVGAGVPLYSCYLTSPVGSVGITQVINLPEDEFKNRYLLGTPGNVMTVQIINLGNVSAIMNAQRSFV